MSKLLFLSVFLLASLLTSCTVSLVTANSASSSLLANPIGTSLGTEVDSTAFSQASSKGQFRRRRLVAARRFASNNKEQQPPNELLFSNLTGALVECGVAVELARSLARSSSLASNVTTQQQQQQQQQHQLQFQVVGQHAAIEQSVQRKAEISVRWERENGEEVEQSVYATSNNEFASNTKASLEPPRLLRSIRQTDGSLIFEPFKPSDFRPEVHATTYRCIATSSLNGATLISRDMRVKAIVSTTVQVEVLDELVIEGNSALFKCQIPTFAQDYLTLYDWIEIPNSDSIQLSESSTTLTNANHLFAQQQTLANNEQQQQQQNNESTIAQQQPPLARYYVEPKSGHLHVLNVDASVNYRSFKCRCKNKLTGELVSSVNKGKLIMTESHAPVSPRLVLEPIQSGAYHEGELALLSCNVQSYPRSQISWFKRVQTSNGNEIQIPLVIESNKRKKYAQVSNLLLINNLIANDSGGYICLARNQLGEERSEVELFVRGRLKVQLKASASVLELGKSLALDCTVSGSPIHQVVFRHNQNIIKSISGSNVGSSSSSSSGSGNPTATATTNAMTAEARHHYSNHRLYRQRAQSGAGSGNSDAGYFVVDSSGSSSSLAPPSERTNSDRQVGTTYLENNESLESLDGEENNNSNNNNESSQTTKLSHVIVIVLEPQHAGAYQCFAYNQFESVQASAYIRVLDDPPKFKETFSNQVLEQRSDISLQCSAKANPLPEITWTVDGSPIPETLRTRFGDFVTKDNLVISYVNISSVQVTDSGLYKCIADNGLAQISHQAQISVSGHIQVKPMLNATVLASTSFIKRCPVAGYPVTEIQWRHNGRRLPANHRQHVFENGSLLVEHMEKSQGDGGEYTCLASGLNGSSASGSLQISIKVRPTIEPFTISRSLREGQRASIMCTISSGDLPISIYWFRNDHLLLASNPDSTSSTTLSLLPNLTPQVVANELLNERQMSSSNHLIDTYANVASGQQQQQTNGSAFMEALSGVRISRVSDYSSTLLFESLLVQHSANYTCLARNDAGSVSHTAPMIVQVAPKWSIEPSDTNVLRGSSTSIDCMASGVPSPRIIWTKAVEMNSDKQVRGSSLHLGAWRSIVSSPHLQVYENGSLTILDARDSDLGHYMCQAANGVGPGLSKVIRVTVNVGAQFSSRHSIQYVARGEQVQLKCQAKGDWPIAIHWFKNRNRLEPINVQDHSSASGSAGLPAPSSSVVLPVNLLSSSIASLLLVPNANLPPLNQLQAHRLKGSIMEQMSQLLGAELSGQQQQRQTMDSHQKEGGRLVQRYSLTSTELALSMLSPEATSLDKRTLFGSEQSQQQLANRQQQQPLLVQLNSMLTISQAERQDTSTFKCFAANHFGLDERTMQLIVQEPPDKIDKLEVLEVSSRSVTLAWLAPYDGNAPILSYHVQYKPIVVSKPSPSQQSLTTTSIGAQVSPEAMNNNLSWLNYTLPGSGSSLNNANETSSTLLNSNLAIYQQHDKSSRGQQQQQAGRSLVKITISSLRPVTQYWFRVAAENKLGHSAMSEVVENATFEEAPGGAPSKLKAIAQSSSSILVSWQRLIEKDVFGPVHGYYVAYKPLISDSSGLIINGSVATSESSHTTNGGIINIYKTIQHDEKLNKFDALLTNLKRSTKYIISVQAFNARGTGPSTEPVVVSTLDLDPPRQVKLFAKQSTNCSILLEWRPLSQSATSQLVMLQQESSSKVDQQQSKSNKLPLALPYLSMHDNQIAASNNPQVDLLSQQRKTTADLLDIVDYYSLYQAELNERPRWQEIRLPGHSSSHLIDRLRCGTRYQFYMIGVNRIGVGDQSDILDTKTLGGLPLAPDRQSTFDVINTTCYIIRLDHWQDNGCPIREFNVRFKEESQSNWNQLAHVNLYENNSEERNNLDLSIANNNRQQDSSTIKREFSLDEKTNDGGQLTALNQQHHHYSSISRDSDYLLSPIWPTSQVHRSKRETQPIVVAPNNNDVESSFNNKNLNSKRSIQIDKDDIYTLNASPEMMDGNDESEDEFLDYNSDTNIMQTIDASGQVVADYQAAEPSVEELALVAKPNSLVQLQHRQQPEQSQQLFSLLKDSMLPTFDSSELVQPFMEQLPPPSSVSSSSVSSSLRQPNEQQELWRVSTTTGDKSLSLPEQQQQVGKQTNLGKSAGNHDSSYDKVPSVSRASHAIARQLIAQPSQQQDWRRIRLCNLIENTYYSIQMTALNSVGETEAELRILTSLEGLEYNQEIKRQVVARFGGDRLAQSSLAMSDRLNLFALNQWSVLVPITLTLTLMSIIVIATILLRRSSSNSPGSTSTTTTMSSTSRDHCQSYLDASSHHRGHGGAPSAITELGSDMVADSGLDSGGSSALEGRLMNGHLNSLSMYHQNKQPIDESGYGVVGLNNGGHLYNPTIAASSEAATRSSGSPATTGIGTSASSGPPTNNTNNHESECIYLRQDPSMVNKTICDLGSSSLNRGRNVYLCSASKDGMESTSDAIFYGLASSQQGAPYGHQTLQVRHYRREGEFESVDTGENSNNNNMGNNPMYQAVVGRTAMYQPVDPYGNVGQQMQVQQRTMEQSAAGMEEETNGGKKQLDNCNFMSIVDEVARASDSINQQQQHLINGQIVGQNKQLYLHHQPEVHGDQELLHVQNQCNQVDCYNQQQQQVASYASHLGQQQETQVNNFDHSNNSTNNQLAGRLMFDPVYATIRRTFPQAFKYLTLQQQSHNHTNSSSEANSRFNQQQYQTNQQSHSTQEDEATSLLDSLVVANRHNKQAQLSNNDMAFFNSNNLAALNLLTPSATLTDEMAATTIAQLNHQNDNSCLNQ